MSRYDTRTTTFSQEGRLFQVEYALEAISNASTTIGIVTTEGVVLAADRVSPSPLLDNEAVREKIYPVDGNTLCAVAGWTADANVLLSHARTISQRHLAKFNEPLALDTLTVNICDVMQSYTQYGGLRPFGVSFLFCSYSEATGYQLFLTDPAGNYSSWKATAIGQNSLSAQSMLKQEWNESLTLQQGLELASKILKSVSDNVGTAKESEFGAVTLRDNKPSIRILTRAESAELLSLVQKTEKINLDI